MSEEKPQKEMEEVAVENTTKENAVALPSAPATDSTREEAEPPSPPKFNLRLSKYYLNRELTWLEFNRRVLHEAQDKRTPLLERIKFLAIVSSNLDEFFMKRIGGLKQQVGAGVQELSVDGRTPAEQIQASYAICRSLEFEANKLMPTLFGNLKKYGIRLFSYAELEPAQRKELREYYLNNIFPLMTPQAMDPAHPFPFISNLSLNLLVTLHYPGEEELSLARVKVSLAAGIPRFLKLPGEAQHFVPVEDIISSNLDLLFPGMVVKSCELFRITRNANTERDEEKAEDLLAMIEIELRERAFAPIVRMEVAKDMDASHRGMLAAEFGLDQGTDVFEVEGIIAMRDLFAFSAFEGVPQDTPHHPIDHHKLQDSRSIFYIIRDQGPILLHHPYESFTTSVERFLREASLDPKVLAIKMTLYRTSSNSQVVAHLVSAAREGKQITVVLELKARFDEANNIQWASQLEHAGIHVTYGIVGLKTHSKVILVVRKDYDCLRRYAHIGTGNYNADTARLYTDVGMLTCDEDIGRDLTELFNYLTTGYTPRRNYKKILPSPKMSKRALINKIDREIACHSENNPGLIQFKMNALEDVEITRALYKASLAGVRIDLLVRDTCRLRPGIVGLSETVRVISLIGRFLEHARVFYFRNGGEEEYYIGSADCMQRNLESRVEVLVAIEEPALRAELRTLLDTQIEDVRMAWDMQPDGTYLQRRPAEGQRVKNAQQIMIDLAEKRSRDAGRLRKRKTQTIARRAIR